MNSLKEREAVEGPGQFPPQNGKSKSAMEKNLNSGAHGISRLGDRVFQWLTLIMAFSVFVLIVLIGFELFNGSKLALQKFGWHFLVNSNWDPVNEVFGALPFIYGTLVTSCIALLI